MRPAATPCGAPLAPARRVQPGQPAERGGAGAGPSSGRCGAVAARSSTAPLNNIVANEQELNLIIKDEYRRGVGVCLVNREGLVFAAR